MRQRGLPLSIDSDRLGSLPTVGDNNGDITLSLCDHWGDEAVAVGLHGLAGERVYAVGLICAGINSDGTLQESWHAPLAGGTDGYAFSEMCPENQILVNLNGRAGDWLTKIGIGCAPLPQYREKGDILYYSPQHGGNRGNHFSYSLRRSYPQFL